MTDEQIQDLINEFKGNERIPRQLKGKIEPVLYGYLMDNLIDLYILSRSCPLVIRLWETLRCPLKDQLLDQVRWEMRCD